MPLEAQIAAARHHGEPRHRLGRGTVNRTVHVQLLAAEAVHRDAIRVTDELGPEHVAIEGVGARSIGYVNHTVVEGDLDDATLTDRATRPAAPRAQAGG